MATRLEVMVQRVKVSNPRWEGWGKGWRSSPTNRRPGGSGGYTMGCVTVSGIPILNHLECVLQGLEFLGQCWKMILVTIEVLIICSLITLWDLGLAGLWDVGLFGDLGRRWAVLVHLSCQFSKSAFKVFNVMVWIVRLLVVVRSSMVEMDCTWKSR